MQPTISILICTLKERQNVFAALMLSIMRQCNDKESFNFNRVITGVVNLDRYLFDEVEILVATDDRNVSTGEKRNMLYQNAMGVYSVSIDDDDEIPKYYIEELLKAAKSGCDCFAINGTISTNGTDIKQWIISKDLPYNTVKVNSREYYQRYPNHITPILTSITKQFKFPNITVGEDYNWATQIHNSKFIQTEFTINKEMYYYKFKTIK